MKFKVPGFRDLEKMWSCLFYFICLGFVLLFYFRVYFIFLILSVWNLGISEPGNIRPDRDLISLYRLDYHRYWRMTFSGLLFRLVSIDKIYRYWFGRNIDQGESKSSHFSCFWYFRKIWGSPKIFIKEIFRRKWIGII